MTFAVISINLWQTIILLLATPCCFCLEFVTNLYIPGQSEKENVVQYISIFKANKRQSGLNGL